MRPSPSLTYKIATEDWEFEAIHRLNYKTFVEEIPQHQANPDKKLVDTFHDENTYFICLQGDRLIGMVAVRANRPFSLDKKLDNLEAYLPEALREGRSMCEIRLLAMDKGHRSSRIAYKMLQKMGQYCESQGYDLWLISGTTEQIRLYEHIGFKPFGPLVGASGAQFQPMYLRFESIESRFW
jgi:GNAT superfamily N-acetyltransferase